MKLRAKPIIQAHRGASAYAPENTMEAFRMARDMRADAIELDVHLTRDGKLVVIHDADISRTSNGHGAVADMSLAELNQYNFAAGFAEQYSSTRVHIPTLEEVYDLVRGTGMLVNVELKGGGEDMVHLVAEHETKCHMEGLVIYSSFNHDTVKKIKEICPTARTGMLYCDGIYQPVTYASMIQADALHPAIYHLQNTELVKAAHQNNMRIHVWTVNEESDFTYMAESGVDAIITNYPDRARKIISSI